VATAVGRESGDEATEKFVQDLIATRQGWNELFAGVERPWYYDTGVLRRIADQAAMLADDAAEGKEIDIQSLNVLANELAAVFQKPLDPMPRLDDTRRIFDKAAVILDVEGGTHV
jgi:hypothetical protein